MKRHWKWLKAAFIILCALGILWFCMPVLHGGFAEGSMFGIAVCGLGMGIAMKYKRAAGEGQWPGLPQCSMPWASAGRGI